MLVPAKEPSWRDNFLKDLLRAHGQTEITDEAVANFATTSGSRSSNPRRLETRLESRL